MGNKLVTGVLSAVKATSWRYGVLRRSNEALGHCDRCGQPITSSDDVMWVQVSNFLGFTATQRVHGMCGNDWGLPLPITDAGRKTLEAQP